MPTTHAIQPDKLAIPSFEIDDSLQSWNMPAEDWLSKNQKPCDVLVTSCVVFNPLGQVLLVQRASHDWMPDKWEIPGGAADDEDTTLFTAAARELREEAGLVATRFSHPVPEGPGQEPGQIFTIGTKTWCRFCFIVEVEDCDSVRLDPNEHQDYVWATAEEVRLQKIGDREIPITTEQMSRMILEAFRLQARKAES